MLSSTLSTSCRRSANKLVRFSLSTTSNNVDWWCAKRQQEQYYQKKQTCVVESTTRRYYFTNGDNVKRDDPYAILGLSYGDGSTTKEIQHAFRSKASQLHPDVNKMDTPAVAIQKFQQLQKAYETLMKVHNSMNGIDEYKNDEWRFSVWRSCDRIAIDRTDVAGIKRKRPIMPATKKESFYGSMIGHPQQINYYYSRRNGEYIGDGKATTTTLPPSSVGRGFNKWVEKNKNKEYKSWNGISSTTRAKN